MKAILIRRETSSEGTFGTLITDALQMHTLELPWANNQRDVSCIPCGTYPVTRYASPSGRRALALVGVPGRDYILIHSGNTTKDIEGCILVGRQRGELNGMPAVLDSRNAMLDLLHTHPDGFDLTIVSLCDEDFRVK